ncbi:MAG: hypothetical protein HUK24_08650 [Sphaerochaetaceae bacterium]|nr:hypothetical protein [Sphaerochaetaceae bacterium]
MSGDDKALAFLGNNLDSKEAFEILTAYISTSCPDARINVQNSLIMFKTNNAFAFVSLPENKNENMLFNLALTIKKPIESQRIDKVIRPTEKSAFVVHIPIRDKEDIDQELMSWIRQSYEYSRRSFSRIA